MGEHAANKSVAAMNKHVWANFIGTEFTAQKAEECARHARSHPQMRGQMPGTYFRRSLPFKMAFVSSPATKPQKGAPTPSKVMSDAATRKAMRPPSRSWASAMAPASEFKMAPVMASPAMAAVRGFGKPLNNVTAVAPNKPNKIYQKPYDTPAL